MTRPAEQHDLIIQFQTEAARTSFVSFMDHYGDQVYHEWMRGGGDWPDEVRFDYTQARKSRPNTSVTITTTLIAINDVEG